MYFFNFVEIKTIIIIQGYPQHISSIIVRQHITPAGVKHRAHGEPYASRVAHLSKISFFCAQRTLSEDVIRVSFDDAMKGGLDSQSTGVRLVGGWV